MTGAPGADRDTWDRWEVLTTPMTEPEARQVAAYIDDAFDDVSTVVQSPRQVLRLAWDRETALLIRDGLVLLQESGRHVPQGMIDDLDHWISHVAEPPAR